MSQAKVMYVIGIILFILNAVGFAIQGYLFGIGGLFLIGIFAFYMVAVYLHFNSSSLKKIATYLVFTFGVVTIIGAVVAERFF